MKVVGDEGVPRQLVDALREHGVDASRFPRGWISLGNRELLRAVDAAGFAVLITKDKNIADQQSLRGPVVPTPRTQPQHGQISFA